MEIPEEFGGLGLDCVTISWPMRAHLLQRRPSHPAFSLALLVVRREPLGREPPGGLDERVLLWRGREVHRSYSAWTTPAYVAAPITATRRVIGFLHADRLGQDRAVGPEDLECIALFADRFGLLLARSVLAERMQHRRSALHSGLEGALDALDDLDQAAVELDLAAAAQPSDGPAAQHSSAPRRHALLTAREREVVQLVAAGATNRAIAMELVVSVETVKSHMSSIMRKLGATSRAEAVARFLEHAAGESGSPHP